MTVSPEQDVRLACEKKPAGWSLISAVNNEAVLMSCLLKSPDVLLASEVILQTGFSSAATAYNAAIEKAKTDVLVFAHQDVFLPEGWTDDLGRALEMLSRMDPQWAVLGVWGVKHSEERAGYIYCAGLMRVLGESFNAVAEVRSLDESLLIVRKSSGIRFDEHLDGFHMYGTDICLEAARRGLKSYAISAFCIHNTNGYNLLPLPFWKAYFFMRSKWRAELPVITPCLKITFWCWSALWWNIDRMTNIALGRHKPGKRVPDASQLYCEVARPGSVKCIESCACGRGSAHPGVPQGK